MKRGRSPAQPAGDGQGTRCYSWFFSPNKNQPREVETGAPCRLPPCPRAWGWEPGQRCFYHNPPQTSGVQSPADRKDECPQPRECSVPGSQPSCLTIAKRNLKEEKREENPEKQTEAERQVRGCYRRARYKSVKTTLQTQKTLGGLFFQELLQPGRLGTAGLAPGTHRCHRLCRRRVPLWGTLSVIAFFLSFPVSPKKTPKPPNRPPPD